MHTVPGIFISSYDIAREIRGSQHSLPLLGWGTTNKQVVAVPALARQPRWKEVLLLLLLLLQVFRDYYLECRSVGGAPAGCLVVGVGLLIFPSRSTRIIFSKSRAAVVAPPREYLSLGEKLRPRPFALASSVGSFENVVVVVVDRTFRHRRRAKKGMEGAARR